MLYLLDANVLMTAHNTYYPIDRVPEFWGWLQHQGTAGIAKVPQEMYEEILAGRRENDILLDWIQEDTNREALVFEEDVRVELVRRIVNEGYAADLTDEEVEKVGSDPFLIAYALHDVGSRCVVTTENAKPTATRHNRQVPDVCGTFKVSWCGPFEFHRRCGFETKWKG